MGYKHNDSVPTMPFMMPQTHQAVVRGKMLCSAINWLLHSGLFTI